MILLQLLFQTRREVSAVANNFRFAGLPAVLKLFAAALVSILNNISHFFYAVKKEKREVR